MSDRWGLHRAGIINVFQYGEETLHFGGGRLLLRGVNGSGKSTAMNMLLPFLLDADVRRIDAAGEQSGMLRSWMLSGRTETQPTGYLWLEMKRAEDHLVFGCGIKANRNTDTVNHWWFVTDRRPGVDLELVQRQGGSRSPLSAEQLRAELGTDCVWSKDQRPAYRQALHGRLYGGANLDQHLRLLHIVRNPRVGDRVDVDLPVHLHDALPRLSDAAVDDAATPLEKLEEHRHNVAQLASTVRALDALVDTYRQHAQSELRTRAVLADDVARSHRRHEADLRSAREAHLAARTAVEENGAAVTHWAVAVDLHQGEIDTLKKGSAYQDHIQLEDKREDLRRFEFTVEELNADLADARNALSQAHVAVDGAAGSVTGGERKVENSVNAVGQVAIAARLEVMAPAVPVVTAAPIRSERGIEGPPVPAGRLDLAGSRTALGALRAAAQQRTGDIAEAREALDLLDRAAEELQSAERRLAGSLQRQEAAELGDATARSTVQVQAKAWSESVASWDERLAEHRQQAPLTSVVLPAAVAPSAVIADHDALASERRTAINAVQQAHAGRDAELTVQRQLEEETVAEAEVIVAELAGRTLPDPPTLPWQSVRSGPSLAELVDFAEDLDESERAGLEAALEAGGLLAAEVRANGLVSAAGELLAVPGPPLPRSLADVLRVAVPDDLAVLGVDAAFVRNVLAAVSIEPADLGTPSGPTTVTLDGELRLGPLRGRHTKERAEHVGVSARRAALDRQRSAAAQGLAAAVLALEITQAALKELTQQRRTADQLAADLPSTSPLVQAIAGLAHAETALATAQAEADRSTDQRNQAEATHATRGDAFRRRCGELDLPHDAAGLTAIDRACEQVPARADNTSAMLDHLAASVDGWLAAGKRWMEAARRRDRAEDQHRRQHDALVAARHELATLEDQIGLDARQVMDTLQTAQRSLDAAKVQHQLVTDESGPARELLGQAVAGEKQAEAALSASDHRCVQTLEHLRKAVSIPGLLGAALVQHLDDDDDVGETGPDPAEPADGDPTLALLPTVPATGAGLRTYARALIDLVPEVPHTPGDNVRAALIKRRPDLGAGWDAQDRQPDASLPLSVEVVGPLGTLPLIRAAITATDELRTAQGLLTAQQDGALRNLLQGLIADEVAEKMHAADELVTRMNARLTSVRTTHGVGVSLRWKQRADLSEETRSMVDLLGKRSEFRQDPEADALLVAALSTRIDEARRAEPESSYATLIARLFDYRAWHQMAVMVHRPGEEPKRLKKGTALSEGEKKMVSYQPLFAAVAASCDALAEVAPTAPRFVLLDDAFAKVSEDNHPKLFGLLVDLELDFIATSERLWGTHDTVPELVITEVLRDADAGVIMLEHSHWDGRHRTEPA